MEKINIKTIVDTTRGGSFGNCSPWKGANDLPWGRKSLLVGPGVGRNYTDLFSKKVYPKQF